MSGWIKISRKIFDNDLWLEDRKFTRFEAWIDLIKSARFASTKKNGIGRGQLDVTSRQLMERWGWGASKVTAFLRHLETERMLERKTERTRTVITICNYDKYNTTSDGNGTQNSTDSGTLKKEREEIKNILSALNLATGKNFKESSSKTSKLIEARLNEGYTEENFLHVIKVKSEQWKNTDMDRYLRPETLFSNKFESYLNEKPKSNERKFVR